MKLPINLLLYLVSAGLLAFAGYTFWKALPKGSRDALQASSQQGVTLAKDRLKKGTAQGPSLANWNYASSWWQTAWNAPNVIGKEPPKPEAITTEPEQPVVPVDNRPISDVIELQAVFYDGGTGGKGGESHVIVRYKDGVEVQPPLWYLLENQGAVAGAAARGGPGDAIATQPGRPSAPRPTTPLPMSSAGREIVQHVWAAGEGERKEATLWAPHDDIKLVRVAGDSLSAWFVRVPRVKDPAAPAPKEEEVFKGQQNMDQNALRALAELRRGNEAARLQQVQNQGATGSAPSGSGNWIDVAETQKKDGVWQIARKEDPDRLLEQVSFESYRSRTGSGLTGLRISNVAPDVAARFGVAQGDVLLAVNGERVSTKAEAINVGKKQYNRGTRTFVLRFLTANGTEVERPYQAPDK